MGKRPKSGAEAYQEMPARISKLEGEAAAAQWSRGRRVLLGRRTRLLLLLLLGMAALEKAWREREGSEREQRERERTGGAPHEDESA